MFLRRCDVESGAGEWVVSSLAASFLAEGITHPEDVGTLAPRGALYLVLELHINCIQVSRVGAERARIPGWVVQCGGPVSIAPRSGLSRKGSPSPHPASTHHCK